MLKVCWERKKKNHIFFLTSRKVHAKHNEKNQFIPLVILKLFLVVGHVFSILKYIREPEDHLPEKIRQREMDPGECLLFGGQKLDLWALLKNKGRKKKKISLSEGVWWGGGAREKLGVVDSGSDKSPCILNKEEAVNKWRQT